MINSAIWRRLDTGGHDAAFLQHSDEGWLLRGTAVYRRDERPLSVTYAVAVDPEWRSLRANLGGFHGTKTFAHTISRNQLGWNLDGVVVRGLDHLLDIDLGFTPATNCLQLRRAALRPGESVDFPVVWFDIGAPTLTELSQRYECVTETIYNYEAPIFGYKGRITLLSPFGFVKQYPDLWEAELR